MKTSIIRTLAALSFSAALGPVSLMAQGPLHFTVPFDFTAGSNSLAAGEYHFRQQVPHVLAIQSVDGHSAMVIMTVAAQANKTPGKATLMFYKYGDRYFLSRVSDSDHGWELPKSYVEKELIAQRASPKPVVVARGEQ